MEKIIIENRSKAPLSVALEAVQHVISGGRISDNGKQYCYYSILQMYGFNLGVGTYLNDKSDRFVVVDHPKQP